MFHGAEGDVLRHGLLGEAICLAALADVPVLAELAGQVAAGSAEGERAAAGVEVVERFLFDRVDAKAGAATPGGELQVVADALAHKTGGALAFVQAAGARTQIAFDPTVVQRVPVTGGNSGCCVVHVHLLGF